MQSDRLGNGRTFLCFGHILVFDPLQAMAGDFPTGVLHGLHLFRAAGQSGSDTIDGQRNISPRKQPVQAPETGAGAVFIDGFHVPVAFALPLGGTRNIGQERLGRRIAMQHAILAAFLVIQHELDSDPGPAWPLWIRRVLTIATHVPGIAIQDGPPRDTNVF